VLRIDERVSAEDSSLLLCVMIVELDNIERTTLESGAYRPDMTVGVRVLFWSDKLVKEALPLLSLKLES
jgi:hypothetical protein